MLPTTSFNKNPLLSFAGIDPNGNGNGGVILLGASEEKEKEPLSPIMTVNSSNVLQEIEDNFSEISLDRDTKDVYMSQTDQEHNKIYASLLDQGSDHIFQTVEPHQEIVEPKTTDSLPLHNLFAQLPSAASTVFSTFSKATLTLLGNKDNSENGERETGNQTKSQSQDYLNTNFVPFENSNQFDCSLMNPQSVVNPINPTFYSPTEFSGLVNKKNVGEVKSNNFRIGHGRKVYAHIPGLTSKNSSISESNFSINHNTFCGQEPSSIGSNFSAIQNNDIPPYISPTPNLTPSYATHEEGINYSGTPYYASPQLTQKYMEYDNNNIMVMTEKSQEISGLTHPVPINPVTSGSFAPTKCPETSQSSTLQHQLTHADMTNAELFSSEPCSASSSFFNRPVETSTSILAPTSTMLPSSTYNFTQNDPIQQLTLSATQDASSSITPLSAVTPLANKPQSLTMLQFSEVSNTPPNQNSNDNSVTSQKANNNIDSLNQCSFAPTAFHTDVLKIGNQFVDKLSESVSNSTGFSQTQCLSKFEETDLENNLISKRQQHQEEHPMIENTSLISTSHQRITNYRQVYCHWFYQSFQKWFPFSMQDSLNIELNKNSTAERITTDNGKFEVVFDPYSRHPKRIPIYYGETGSVMQRCSWFYYDGDANHDLELSDFFPFDEMTSEKLEKEYEAALKNKTYSFELSIPSNSFVTMKNSEITYQSEGGMKFKVRRGIDDFLIEDGESRKVDHIVLYIYNGETSAHIHANDKLRAKLTELIQCDFPDEFDCGEIGMIEVLPIGLPFRSSKIQEIIREKKTLNSDSFQEAILQTSFFCSREILEEITQELACEINEMVRKFNRMHQEMHGNACSSISLMANSFEGLFCYHVLNKLDFDVNSLITINMPTILLLIDKPNFVGATKILNFVNERDRLTCLQSKNNHFGISNIKFECEQEGSPLMSRDNLNEFAHKIFNIFYH